MKQFPRLHSLATLGIRQHQEFDYSFHGFRTDFVGDSGSGKSMIADLLQLVFTGSEVFHSATEGLDKREAEGMILKTPGKGTDMAYVMVNIEVGAGKYLVIGAYLESISKHSKSFILQRSYNEDELDALYSPVSCRDLLIDDQIPTLDVLKSALEENGIIYHGFAHRKKFHSYLFRHGILNLDLSSSQQVLKDYAIIIQSFSRGKNLDVANSDSLKNFIFGKEKAKEILEKYNRAVEELQSSLKEFAVNRQELDIATLKYNVIQELRGLENDFNSKQEDWFVKQCAYLEQEAADSFRSLKDSCKQHIENLSAIRGIQELIRQEQAGEQEKSLYLEEATATAKSAYDGALLRHQKVKPIHALLTRLQCNPQELAERYHQYHAAKIKKELIDRITSELTAKNCYALALKLDANQDLDTIIQKLDNETGQLKADYDYKSVFKDFVKGNNQGTLGHWFSQHYSPQPKVIESILLFYKSLPVFQKQAGGEQFIFSPELFLNEAVVSEEDEKGFWLAHGELRQYISFVGNPLFIAPDAQAFQLLLQQVGTILDNEMQEIELQINQKKHLKSYVIKTPNFLNFLKYQAEEDQLQLSIFEEDPDFDIDLTDLDQGIALLDQFGQIKEAYQTAQELWDDAKDAANDYRHFLQGLKQTNNQLSLKTTGLSSGKILESIAELFPEMQLTDLEIQRQTQYYEQQYQKSPDKNAWISATANAVLQGFKYADLNAEISAYNELIVERDNIFKEARLELVKEPDIAKYRLIPLSAPTREMQAYEVAKAIYHVKFSEIAKTHAPGDAYKFQNSFNFIELTVSVLPNAFLSEEAKEENFITQIEKYFSQINEKNKTLNSRKLHRIKEILDEVDDEIERRLDTVRKLHLFLNDEDQEITGGHRVSLRAEENPGYPRKWIQDYIDKLEQEDTLFTTGQTLDELLKDSTSLQEKMIAAFHVFGGHKSVKATVETLLNPNSYFKLSFAMESQATGKSNSGSTGQTYAATALLCIARLSLVNKTGFSREPTPGIRFMPIDEAEGLGSNFDMLHEIARKFDYQIITMSISPLSRFNDGGQYIYILSNNKSADNNVNHPPLGIFSDADRPTNFIV